MAKRIAKRKEDRWPARMHLRLLALLMVLPALAVAQSESPTEQTTPETGASEAPAIEGQAEADAPGSQSAKQPGNESGDRCDAEAGKQPVQEMTRETLRSWSCHSFRWFDGLWGNTYDFDEDAVRGWMTFGAEYTQYDHFDPRLRLRVRAPLPNMNRRWDLILGRVDEERYVSDTEIDQESPYDPGTVNRRDEEIEWLLGLGHRGRDRRSGWDWDAGVRLRTPPEPYAKLQYYYNKQFQPGTRFNFRQTFFWRSDDGFGTTGRGDFSHELDLSNVLRTEAIATHSEASLGTQWYFGQTWYHRIEGEKGFSLLAFISGETDHAVPLREYGFNLLWRTPFTRDWLYLSIGPSVTWPKELETEDRDMSLGFGAWIEVEFGDWHY